MLGRGGEKTGEEKWHWELWLVTEQTYMNVLHSFGRQSSFTFSFKKKKMYLTV